MLSKPTIKIMPKTERVSEDPRITEATTLAAKETRQATEQARITAVNLEHYRPKKKAISIRLDADVLSWFQDQPGKYQKLINQACRTFMENHKSES